MLFGETGRQAVMQRWSPHGLNRASQAGYGVIFLTRTGTVQPFSDGLPEGELQERMLDMLAPHGEVCG